MYLGRIVELGRGPGSLPGNLHAIPIPRRSSPPFQSYPDPRRRSQHPADGDVPSPSRRQWLPLSPALPHATDLCCAARPPFEACGGQGTSGGLPFPPCPLREAVPLGRRDMMPAPAASQPASLQRWQPRRRNKGKRNKNGACGPHLHGWSSGLAVEILAGRTAPRWGGCCVDC